LGKVGGRFEDIGGLHRSVAGQQPRHRQGHRHLQEDFRRTHQITLSRRRMKKKFKKPKK